MSDGHLDDAIDRAVREMMSVDAPEEVKARVLARLESSGWTMPWFRVAAVTSLAAAVLAAFVIVRSREAGPVRQPVHEPVGASIVAVPPPARPRAEEYAPGPPPVPATRARVVTAAHVEAYVALSFEIDPLTAMHPIVIAPIEHESIGPATLALTPLAPILDVHVKPLNPSGEPN